jgi:hypothetical protein
MIRALHIVPSTTAFAADQTLTKIAGADDQMVYCAAALQCTKAPGLTPVAAIEVDGAALLLLAQCMP